MPEWKWQDAKTHFGELVRRAAVEPQTITVHGRRAAVLLSADDYDHLKRPKRSLAAFMRASPLAGIHLDVERDRSPPCDIEF